MRKLLYEAANTLIQRVPRFSSLKARAVTLAKKKGLKKATVAAARKIAVMLTRIWRDGIVFALMREELRA
ncbi:MAG: hypothetical protein AAF360_12915 [Pseudomonadota bacterium]